MHLIERRLEQLLDRLIEPALVFEELICMQKSISIAACFRRAECRLTVIASTEVNMCPQRKIDLLEGRFGWDTERLFEL